MNLTKYKMTNRDKSVGYLAAGRKRFHPQGGLCLKFAPVRRNPRRAFSLENQHGKAETKARQANAQA